jgi:hypothetical protein
MIIKKGSASVTNGDSHFRLITASVDNLVMSPGLSFV